MTPPLGYALSMREEDLQRQVADYLDRFLPDDSLWWHTPNGSERNRAVAAKLKSHGVKPGVPDVTVLWRGRPIFIELKTARGSLQPDQRTWRDRLTEQGVPWALCRSLDEVVAFLVAQGLPMKARLARPVGVR